MAVIDSGITVWHDDLYPTNRRIVWGIRPQNIVWATNIVWSTNIVSSTDGDDNIVWSAWGRGTGALAGAGTR